MNPSIRTRLIQAREQHLNAIQSIDEAMKFFDEHPEMEKMLSAMEHLQGGPIIARSF